MAEDPLNTQTPEQQPVLPQNQETFSSEDLYNQANALMAESEDNQAEFTQEDLFNQALALNQEQSGYETFASNLVKLRDDPVGVSALGSILQAVQTGNLKDRYKKAYDYALVDPAPIKAEEQLEKAVNDGDVLGSVKAYLGLSSANLVNFFNLALGRNEKEAEAASLSAASTNLIGKIEDPKQAAQALELTDAYVDKLDKGESISPEGEKPRLIVRTKGSEGFVTQYNVGMNMAEAESYLSKLIRDRGKPVTESSARVFFAKGVDALPFVTADNIFIDDEKDPDQVAKRSALIQKINDTISKDYYYPSLAGMTTGSVTGFAGIGGAVTRGLGTSVNVGGTVVRIPNALTKWATYGLYGGGQAVEEVRPLSWEQNLLNTFEQIAGLGVSEFGGEVFEHQLVAKTMGAKIAGTALATAVPKLAPVYKNAAFLAGSTLGETVSNQIDRIFAGQNPQEGLGEDFATAFGVSLGMLGVSSIGGRRASPAQAEEVMDYARQDLTRMFENTVSSVKQDSRFTFRQRDQQLRNFRNSLPTDEAKGLFDAVNLKYSVDRTVLPETAKVAQEQVDKAARPALDSLVKKTVEKAKSVPVEVLPPEEKASQPKTKGQLALPAPKETVSLEQAAEEAVVNQIIPALEAARKSGQDVIQFPLTVENKRILDYLDDEGRLSGVETEGSNAYEIDGIRDKSGRGFGVFAKTDPLDSRRQALESDLEDSGLSFEKQEEVRDQIYGVEGRTKAGLDAIQAQIGVTQPEKQVERDLEKERLLKPKAMAEAEISKKKAKKEVEQLKRKVLEVPTLQLPQAQQELAAAQEKEAKLASSQEEIVKRGVQQRLDEIAAEVDQETETETVRTKRKKVLPKTLEKEESFNLPIAIKGEPIAKRFAESKPNPFLEDDPAAIPQVFGTGGKLSESELDYLKGIGAIDENNVPVMGPVAAAMEQINRLARNSLGNPQWEIIQKAGGFDKAISASVAEFTLMVREGKSGAAVDLENIFFSNLKDLRRKAATRAKYKVGSVSEASIDLPGNPVAIRDGVIDQDISEAEKQVELEQSQENIPEATRQIAIEAVRAATTEFEAGLKTSADKKLFEYYLANPGEIDKDKLSKDAKSFKLDAKKFKSELNRIASAFEEKVQEKLDEANARYAEKTNVEAAKEVDQESDGFISEQEIRPVFSKFRKMDESGLFLPQERLPLANLINKIQNERNKGDLERLSSVLNWTELAKLGFVKELRALNPPEAVLRALNVLSDNERGKPVFEEQNQRLETIREQLEGINLISAATPGKKKDLVLDQDSFNFYQKQINEAKAEYKTTLQGKDLQAKIDGAYKYRARLLALDNQIKGAVNRANIGERKRAEPIRAADLRTKEGKSRLANRALERAIDKRVGAIARGTEYRKIPGDPTKLGKHDPNPRPEREGRGYEPVSSEPVPEKPYIVTAQQEGFDYGKKTTDKILRRLGDQIVSNLNDRQKFHVVQSKWALENVPSASKVLALGPGRGKSRIVLALGDLAIKEKKKVILVAPSEVIRPDWQNGKIRHVIQSDANTLGIPIELRGSVYKPLTEATFDKIIVTTYDTRHLEQLSKIVDQDTLVIWDEFQTARNLENGKWAKLIDLINARTKTGQVIKATGTPIDSILHLGSYAREMFEGKELYGGKTEVDIEEFILRHGYKLQKLRGGRAEEYLPIPPSDVAFDEKQLSDLRDKQAKAFDKRDWKTLKAIDAQIGVDKIEADRRLSIAVAKWAERGDYSSEATSLKGGVNFKAIPVKLTPEVKEELKAVAGSFGNATIVDAEKGEALLGAQKFILERYKIPDAVKTTVKELDKRKRRVVIWVDYINKSKMFSGENARATASMLEASLLAERPGTKIVKIYGDDKDEKALSAIQFQKGEADVVIATRASAGVGGELDDKRGDQPRTFIFLGLPLKAGDFLQTVMRGYRLNTRSPLDVLFLLTNHGADRYAEESLLRSLRAQEAFIDFGALAEVEKVVAEAKAPAAKPARATPLTAKEKGQKIKKAKETAKKKRTEPLFPIKAPAIEVPVLDLKLKARSDAPEDVYIPSTATPEQLKVLKEIDADFKRVFGKAYDKGVFTFLTNNKEKTEYFFKYGFANRAPYHDIGSSDINDEIVIDPEWIATRIKSRLSPKDYAEWLKTAIHHEKDHVTITRLKRKNGEDARLWYSNVGDSVGPAGANLVADIYSALNNLSTREAKLVKASFASDPVRVGAELTRMILELSYKGSVTEQALNLSQSQKDRLDKNLSQLLKSLDITPKRTLSNWMDQAVSVFQMWPKSAMLPASYMKDAAEVVKRFDRIKVEDLISAQLRAPKIAVDKDAPSNEIELQIENIREQLVPLERDNLSSEEDTERKSLMRQQRELIKQLEEARARESKKIEAPKKKTKPQIPQSFLPYLKMSNIELQMEIGEMDFRKVEKMLGEAGATIDQKDTKKAELSNKQTLLDQIVKYQGISARASFPGEEGPIRMNRPTNILDRNDLKVVRQLDNVLSGKTNEFLGRPVRVDMYGPIIDAGELNLGIATNEVTKKISQFESTLLNQAASEVLGESNQSMYVDEFKRKVMEIAEALVATRGDESIPEAAMVSVNTPLPEDADPRDPDPKAPASMRGVYTVAVGQISPGNTTGASPKHATSMFVFRTIAKRNIRYNGQLYKQGSERDAKRLISVLEAEDPTFEKFAKRRSDYAGFPSTDTPEKEEKYRTRAGGVNLIASLMSYIPNAAIRERMLESLVYRQVPVEEQLETGRNYISKVGIVKATSEFFADSIPLDLPGRASVGFSLVPYFTRLAADGDVDAQATLDEIVQKLSRTYGTDPGRAVQLWRVGPDVAAQSPQVFLKLLEGQLEAATKIRMKPFIPDIQETFDEIQEADQVAANAFASAKETNDVLGQIEAIRRQTEAEKLRIADLDSEIANYINSESANELNDIFGDITNLASLPTSGEGEGDGLGFDDSTINKLSNVLLKVIRLGFAKNPEIVQKEKLRTVVLLSPFFSQAKNKEEVLRVFNHHFEAAYSVAATAFRDEQKAKLEELRQTAEKKEAELSGLQTGKVTRRKPTPEAVQLPKTRGEAKRRAKQVEKELDSESPVEVSDEPGTLMSLTTATAKALVKYADRVRNPQQRDALKEFASKLRRMMIGRTKEKGGLEAPIEDVVKPSAAQSLKELIAQYPEVLEFVNDVRATLDEKYTPEQVEGLEPLIEEALGRPFTISNLNRVIRSLETIGGPKVNINRLIRESQGNVAQFEVDLKAALLDGTNLSPREQDEVKKYLSEGLAEMIQTKREEALDKMRDRIAKKGEKKAKKYKTALDRLRENVNLGVLRYDELYSQIHQTLGLPEIGMEERMKLEEMVKALDRYPKGRILNEKVEEIYQYIKLIAPVSIGELAVSYQTANFLQGIGTLAVNCISSIEGIVLDGWVAGINASLKSRFGGPEQKLQALAIRMGRQALKDAWWGKDIEGKGMARKYASQIWKFGRFPADSVVLKETGGINIFESMLREAEAGRAGKRGLEPATLVVRKPKVPAWAQALTDYVSSFIPSFIAKPVKSLVSTNETEIKVNLQAGWEPTSETKQSLAKLFPTKYIAPPILLKDIPFIGKYFGKLGKIADLPAWPYNSFLGPYILSSRLMASGDAFNKFGVKKMSEVIEAGYLVAKNNPLLTEEQFISEVNNLLNRTQDSIERAGRLADIDAATFGLDPDQRLLRIEEILDQNREQNELTKQIEENSRTRALRASYQDDFYGVVGAIAGSIDALARTSWMPQLVFKFLKTASNLTNEALNYTPLISNWRMMRGVGRILASDAPRYYRPAPMPNTPEYDVLKGKMLTGYSALALFVGLIAAAMNDDDENPFFFIHVKGPRDPQARKAYFQMGGKTRCLQIGKIGQPFAPLGVKLWDGPLFISFESLPPGLTGVLMPVGYFAEALRYDDKSTAEAFTTSMASAALGTAIGFVDLTALQGMRSIMRLISPAPNAGADDLLQSFGTAMSGILAGVFVPYYPTIRDMESIYDGLTGTPKSRLPKDGFMSSLASSFPVVAKFGQPDLDHLGGRVSSRLVNNLPVVKRFFSAGVDTSAYDNTDNPTDQAVHDKLITLFAKHGRIITWNAGELKEMAMLELAIQASQGIPIDKSPYELLALSRDLTWEEKYDWVQQAGPLIQIELERYIPAMENAKDNAEFDYILSKTKVNDIKRAVLKKVVLESIAKEGLEKVQVP